MADQAVTALARRLTEIERRLSSTERASRLERATVMVDAEAGTSLDVSQALTDATTAPANLARAVLALAAPDQVADGILTVWFTDGVPAALPGDLWLDPNQILWQHDGTVLVPLPDQSYAQTVYLANDALSTADGFITTFWQAGEPAAGSVGDLWFKADNANTPYRWDGNLWVSLVTQAASSATYQQGIAGWSIDNDGDAQFQDVQVLGALGAATVNAGAVVLAGEDLAARLAAMPRGVLARAIRGSATGIGAGDTVGAAELLLFDFSAGNVQLGRLYKITIHGFLQGTVVGDTFEFQVRNTFDNTAPAVPGSNIMDGSSQRFYVQTSFTMEFFYAPTLNHPLRMGLTLRQQTGTGVARIYLASMNRQFEWTLEDVGMSVNTSTSLAQIAKMDGSAADPTPGATFTKTYPATWGKNYRSTGTSHILAPRPAPSINPVSLGQGYNPDGVSSVAPGQTSDRGLFGFDSTAIVADMAAATIVEAYLTFTTRYRRSSTGLDVRIAKHNYGSAPSSSGLSFPNANVVESVASINDCAPSGTYKVALGATIGAEFKAGTTKGLGFASPADATNYDGYMYGADGDNPPVLTIVYTA